MPRDLSFSIIIPVYNRPNELEELLASIVAQTYEQPFEVVVVDDGSVDDLKSEIVVQNFRETLAIQYFYKPNTGAGLSRNFGMAHATGNYFIILDSDVILPQHYLTRVSEQLTKHFTDIFGGPDAAHKDFTPLQKAINYSMTSFWTTGGLRGGKNNKNFQPRSFNLGMSREVFQATGGFSKRKIGEDIDFSFRARQSGFSSQLIPEAFVFHKRRNTLKQFYKQTRAFGSERPKLNKEFPGTAKLTYWFPTAFALGFILALVFKILGWYLPLGIYGIYIAIIGADATVKNHSPIVGLLAIVTTFIQFFGYGFGYLKTLVNQ